MRILKSILAITMLAFVTVSCSDNDESTLETVVSKKVENLHAKETNDYSVSPPLVSGEFVKFSFKTGGIVTGNNWDIAFRGTTILVNGGDKTGISGEPERTGNAALAIEEGVFADITVAPTDTDFVQDSEEGLALPKGTWYTYNPANHLVSATAGKVIIVKTVDGHYAKMEILSYYKDMDSSNSADPVNSGAQYYTFNYVYNSNAGDKSFQ
ncbi:HmuY family protein [Tenacibaculum caenipelagi]|uniref:Heme-binding HmuY-like protein n=1 Tax=Tenacibaculum caenipelagi TaxID=1325435 RepID=A0A4R6TLL8_9FLAO|nr:HmuY family protein [Tenacibaculum caenipelagi]TDQ29930.1 heme-binding HmuY-like protein [Tenacibaculum caenipelagi]